MYSVAKNADRIFQDSWVETASENSAHSAQLHSIHRIRQRIQLQIPPKYTKEPIISNLANRYEVEVNIESALLASNSQESGWFDLELYGTPDRIQQGLDYLTQLQIEIWGSDRFVPRVRTAPKGWSFS
jgi:ABC-type methionine transport system ATPase subunit